ncbi:MAG: RNA polymerase sigma factor [Planctomycetota bacterium]|jgi:RNA polymerase sigma-70 factor (ECF subfamily)
MIEDELLKWKFKRGSGEALARIYEKYVNSLLSLAVGLLNDPHDAEDVVQDMFVSFAQSAGSFGLKGSLKAYLATSVVNRARDRLRRGGSLHRRMGKYATVTPDAGRADESLVYSERCERLSRALAELPYEQREAVVLKVKQNMTLKEIAKLQGVSISTVHGRYRYGLDKLRALLDGEIRS